MSAHPPIVGPALIGLFDVRCNGCEQAEDALSQDRMAAWLERHADCLAAVRLFEVIVPVSAFGAEPGIVKPGMRVGGFHRSAWNLVFEQANFEGYRLAAPPVVRSLSNDGWNAVVNAHVVPKGLKGPERPEEKP